MVYRLRADDGRLTTDDHDRLPSLARQRPVVHRPLRTTDDPDCSPALAQPETVV
jgi:hypothetical protein